MRRYGYIIYDLHGLHVSSKLLIQSVRGILTDGTTAVVFGRAYKGHRLMLSHVKAQNLD